MTNSETATPLAPSLAALSLAEDIVRDALRLAAANNWPACPEQFVEAAYNVLQAARLLPDRPSPEADLGPFLVWNEGDDGWKVTAEVRSAVRCGGETAARVLALAE